MEKQPDKMQLQKVEVVLHNHFKPITPDYEDETCEYCTYGDQDIDTFPCAKCHTRH